MDYSMSPETVIVGDRCGEFLGGDDFMEKKSKMKCQPLSIAAIALLFMRDRNKPYGIGNIKLHVALSAGLSPVGHTYEVTSVNESNDSMTELTAKREDSDENLDDEAITDTIDRNQYTAFIGVVKKRKCTVGLEKVKWISTQVFREIQGYDEQYLFVRGGGIETGDCFRFFQPDSHMTFSSLRHVHDKFKDLKKSCDVRSSDCQTIRPANGERN